MSSSTDEERLSVLVEQCRATDIDHRIEALVALQSAFESGVEISNSDSIIGVLKSTLRVSNTQLYTSALSAISSYITLLTARIEPVQDVPLVRQLVIALVPAGGLIDRLGESRDKTRENARNALINLGCLCQRVTPGSIPSAIRGKELPRSPETPSILFERLLREVGFVSRVWRVREQSILILAHLRRTFPQYPLRPFVPVLVQSLQDSDGTVRECARRSIVEIFSGSNVTDAARADLKREMEKQNIRKPMQEDILADVIGLSSLAVPLEPSTTQLSYLQANDQHHNDESRPAVIGLERPPSRVADPILTPSVLDAELKPVYIASARDLEQEFAKMLGSFHDKETEHNWLNREQSIVRLRGMLKGGVYGRFEETFIAGLRNGMLESSFKALRSLRTTVAVQACSFYKDLAHCLATALDPFVDALLHQLLRLSSSTKKIISAQSQISIATILQTTSCQPRVIIPVLTSALQEKVPQARSHTIIHVKTFLDKHGIRSKSFIESSGCLETMDKSVLQALCDPSPIVREAARTCYWSFELVWADRAAAIMNKLDPNGRKQLQKVCPRLGAVAMEAQAAIDAKKSTVAAAIAASRAKVKALSTPQPPSLKSQSMLPAILPISVNSSQNSLHKTRENPTLPADPHAAASKMSVTSQPKRRTPSTTSLPASPEHSFRESPSPPQSQDGDYNYHKRTLSSPRNSPPQTKLPSLRASSPRGRVLSHSRLGPLPRPSSNTLVTLVNSSAKKSNTANIAMNGVSRTSDDLKLRQSKILSDKSIPSALLSTRVKQATDSTQSNTAQNQLSAPDPAIEEELRATSAQAEAAAEQLLDLSEPAIDSNHPPMMLVPIPVTVLKPSPPGGTTLPTTPPEKKHKQSLVWQEVERFEDSPMSAQPRSHIAVLREQRSNSSWWLKTKKIVDSSDTPINLDQEKQVEEVQRSILTLGNETITIQDFKTLVWICRNNRVYLTETTSFQPSKAHQSMSTASTESGQNAITIWDSNNLFEPLLNALLSYLSNETRQGFLRAAMLLLWEIVESEQDLLNGHEMRIYEILINMHKSCDKSVLEASVALRDALSCHVEPVYGLSTLHTCLKQFLQNSDSATNSVGTLSSHVFALNGIGKFLLRLPPEVVEDELPRLRTTILNALADTNSVVRSAASMVVVASQVILQDQAHLFALLDGLSEEKKNFLTYMFNKNEIQHTMMESKVLKPRGLQRVESEITKLDDRINPR